jgi:uncharacterized protein (TIGR02246 family)
LSSKRTHLARLEAANLTDRLRRSEVPARYGAKSAAASKREQRRLEKAQEKDIVALIALREAAWNAGDAAAYANLLTEDADIVSATGRSARGREALLKLYSEQRAAALAGAQTRTRVTHVRFLSPEVALADVDYEMKGGDVDAVRRGTMAFIVRRNADRWRIAAIRSNPSRK